MPFQLIPAVLGALGGIASLPGTAAGAAAAATAKTLPALSTAISATATGMGTGAALLSSGATLPTALAAGAKTALGAAAPAAAGASAAVPTAAAAKIAPATIAAQAAATTAPTAAAAKAPGITGLLSKMTTPDKMMQMGAKMAMGGGGSGPKTMAPPQVQRGQSGPRNTMAMMPQAKPSPSMAMMPQGRNPSMAMMPQGRNPSMAMLSPSAFGFHQGGAVDSPPPWARTQGPPTTPNGGGIGGLQNRIMQRFQNLPEMAYQNANLNAAFQNQKVGPVDPLTTPPTAIPMPAPAPVMTPQPVIAQPMPMTGIMQAAPSLPAPFPVRGRPFNRGGYVEGPGTGKSDSIPAIIYQNGVPVQEAALSDKEFVMTADAVKNAGGGDHRRGAARMYRMMRQLENGGRV